MAILDSLPGIESVICIDGKPLDELVDTSEVDTSPVADKAVVKYILVPNDAIFTIEHRVHPSYTGTAHLSFETTIDGKYLGECDLYMHEPSVTTTRTMLDVGWPNSDKKGRSLTRPFKFSAINTVETQDNTKIRKDTKVAQGMGEIVVYVLRTSKPREVRMQRESRRKIVIENDDEVEEPQTEIAEKALKGKGVSHCTGKGDTTIIENHTYMESRRLQKHSNPSAKFIFRYRSKVALQKQLILPYTPTPDPFDTMTPEEILKQARELRERLRNVDDKPVKKEKRQREEKKDDDTPVDLTRDSKRQKITIDLTDD